jgi:hypothetical protein
MTATQTEPEFIEKGIARQLADGILASYLHKGEGRIVQLHGGDFACPVGTTDWVPQLPALGEQFRVLARDRVGQGSAGTRWPTAVVT